MNEADRACHPHRSAALTFFKQRELATVFWALVCGLGLLRVEAGTITGTVKAQGKEGAEDAASGGKYASRQFKFAERVNYEEMHDFVVYIEGRVGTNSPVPEKAVQVVTTRPTSVLQHGAMFE